MKIFCKREDLITGVNTVLKAVSTKNPQPVLQGIKIKAENDFLYFEATDLEIGIRCFLPVVVEEEGQRVLPARLFSEIVRKLPETDIKIESDDNNTNIINIYYDDSSFVLNGFDPEEYPEFSEVLSEEKIELPASLLKSMIKKTIIACAVEETRPVFTGVLLNIENENISLISTDTHRLTYATAVIKGNSQEFYGIIPAKTMQEIFRLLDDSDIVFLRFNSSRITFSFGSNLIISRLIEGQFPNYRQVIPPSCNTKLLVNTKKLLDTVERASLLSKDSYLKASTVRLNIEDQNISINQYSEAGKISEKIDIEQEGQNVAISFNAKYVIDILRIVDTENTVIEMSGAYSPCIFRQENDDNYLCLILPLRN